MKKQIFIPLAIIIGILIGIVCIKIMISGSKQGEVTTVSKASLEKILEINDLSTVDYIYNAIARAYNKDKVKYYVAYEGRVSAGIDFDKVDIEVIEKDKKVIITIPDVEIQDIRVDMETMEYIFEKDRYETETVSAEAYKLCCADLSERAQEDELLFKMAEENAVASLKALFAPWIEQVDGQYTIEIK